jgi:hypothetical protein
MAVAGNPLRLQASDNSRRQVTPLRSFSTGLARLRPAGLLLICVLLSTVIIPNETRPQLRMSALGLGPFPDLTPIPLHSAARPHSSRRRRSNKVPTRASSACGG